MYAYVYSKVSLRTNFRTRCNNLVCCADAELAAALAPDGMSALSAVPAWQLHGSGMAPYHGNGNSGGAAHPGSAVTVQKLLLEGKKAAALRYRPLCRR